MECEKISAIGFLTFMDELGSQGLEKDIFDHWSVSPSVR